MYTYNTHTYIYIYHHQSFANYKRTWMVLKTSLGVGDLPLPSFMGLSPVACKHGMKTTGIRCKHKYTFCDIPTYYLHDAGIVYC